MVSSSARSQRATAHSLTIQEKLDIIPGYLTVAANGIAAIFTGVVMAKEKRGNSYYRHIANTVVRTLTRRLSTRQFHYIFPTTDETYERYCKKWGVKPDSEVLEDGTTAFWIGNKKADKVIINFHGGGYVLPPTKGMVEFMFQLVDVLKAQGKDIAVLFLAYDLGPGAQYPRQLQQASLLLNHVLTNLHIPPSSIILTGDSAGANLAIALLSHISHSWNTHPHSSNTSSTMKIPEVKLDVPLCSLVLLSPFVSMRKDTPSASANAYKDCISPPTGKSFNASWLGPTWSHDGHTDFYVEPATAPLSWWQGLMAEHVLVVGGEDEILIDTIKQFTETLSEGFGKEKLEFFVATGEYHDQLYMDITIGLNKVGKQARKVREYVGSLV